MQIDQGIKDEQTRIVLAKDKIIEDLKKKDV
jgi:hypothetical protein